MCCVIRTTKPASHEIYGLLSLHAQQQNTKKKERANNSNVSAPLPVFLSFNHFNVTKGPQQLGAVESGTKIGSFF